MPGPVSVGSDERAPDWFRASCYREEHPSPRSLFLTYCCPQIVFSVSSASGKNYITGRPGFGPNAVAHSSGCLDGKKKALRKRPFGVKPLAAPAIPRALAHLRNCLRIVFMGAFRPNSFAFPQKEAEAGLAKCDSLPNRGPQMHFHAPLGFVIPHGVFDAREIEIAIQFAVDPREKILVECCRNARCVVICRKQLRHRLFKVRRKQESIAFPEHFANV